MSDADIGESGVPRERRSRDGETVNDAVSVARYRVEPLYTRVTGCDVTPNRARPSRCHDRVGATAGANVAVGPERRRVNGGDERVGRLRSPLFSSFADRSSTAVVRRTPPPSRAACCRAQADREWGGGPLHDRDARALKRGVRRGRAARQRSSGVAAARTACSALPGGRRRLGASSALMGAVLQLPLKTRERDKDR